MSIPAIVFIPKSKVLSFDPKAASKSSFIKKGNAMVDKLDKAIKPKPRINFQRYGLRYLKISNTSLIDSLLIFAFGNSSEGVPLLLYLFAILIRIRNPAGN